MDGTDQAAAAAEGWMLRQTVQFHWLNRQPQPYADFATVNMRGSQLFMNTVGRQMANDRGASLGGGQSGG